MSCLKQFDYYGATYKFTLNKEKRFQSFYGGISYFIVGILFLSYTITRVSQFFGGNDIVREFYIKSHNNAKIGIGRYGHFMILTCLTGTYNFTDIDEYADKALNHTLQLTEVYRRPWLIEKQNYININQCKFDDFPPGFLSPPLYEKYSKCKCISHTQLNNVTLMNFWTEEYYSNLDYRVSLSNELLSNTTKLNEYLAYFQQNNPRLVTFFVETDVDIDTANPEDNPLLDSLNMNTDYINLDFTQRTDIFLNTITYKRDNNYIYSNPVTFKGLIKENSIKMKLYKNNYNTTSKLDDLFKYDLVQTRFFPSNHENVVKRTVSKFIPFLTEILLFLMLLNYYFGYCTKKINNLEKDFYVVNKLFKNKDIYQHLIEKIYEINNDKNECQEVLPVDRSHDNINNKNEGVKRAGEINLQNNQQSSRDKGEPIQVPGQKKKVSQANVTSPKRGLKQGGSIGLEMSSNRFINYDQVGNHDQSSFNVEIIVDKVNENNVNIEEEVEKHLKDIKYIEDAGITSNCFDYLLSSSKNVEDEDVEDSKAQGKNTTQNQNAKKEKNRFYDNAKEILDYYTDISVFVQKMLEMDVIKYVLFSKSERQIIHLLGNPELFFGAKERLRKVLNQTYNPLTTDPEEIDSKAALKKIIEKMKDRNESRRIVKLIKTGVHNAMFVTKR